MQEVSISGIVSAILEEASANSIQRNKAIK